MIYFISPSLTIENNEKALTLYHSCVNEIREYVAEVQEINSLRVIPQIIKRLDKQSILIFFNNSEMKINKKLIQLIQTAKQINCEIWPVALEKDKRISINNVSEKQSYDIYEQLRIRGMSEEYLEVIGKVFARKVISRALPTIYSDKRIVFVSHRRVDGEELTAKLCDKLTIQARELEIFRDVVCVEVGKGAQDEIDKYLCKSDVMIFLHTEKSSESEWIKKELSYAIVNNIPILWVNIDDANSNNLIIKPTDKPHIKCFSLDFEDETKLTNLADEIIHKSFELSMNCIDAVYDQINTFEDFCKKRNITFSKEDEVQLIYSFSYPRIGYAYPQRNIKHYVQYFGRRCMNQDFENIRNYLSTREFNNEKLYDSAILISNRIQLRNIQDNIVEENFEDFNLSLKKYVNEDTDGDSGEIILSGSFNENDMIHKQALKDALGIFAKEILKNGFTLTFGAHPTFQNLIFEIAKLYRPNDYKAAINMYISKYFKPTYNLDELKLNTTVVETDLVSTELINPNLTEMRKRMINSRKSIKALICLGGVIREGAPVEGIDEEIMLARENNIPVYLIGTVGGRSSQLAIEYLKTKEWTKLNEESQDFNSEITLKIDYTYLANKIIESIKSKW